MTAGKDAAPGGPAFASRVIRARGAGRGPFTLFRVRMLPYSDTGRISPAAGSTPAALTIQAEGRITGLFHAGGEAGPEVLHYWARRGSASGCEGASYRMINRRTKPMPRRPAADAFHKKEVLRCAQDAARITGLTDKGGINDGTGHKHYRYR